MINTMFESTLISIVVGGLLIISGRNLFWLFVGVAGFLSGYNLAASMLAGSDPLLLVFWGALAGLTGVFFAVVMQRLAVVVAGFLTGGLIAIDVFTRVLDWTSGWVLWSLLGACIGAAAGGLFFDWTLVILSSLLGAGMIVRSFMLNPETEIILFTGLFAVGLMLQSTGLKKT
ncbi:MAG: hypothetical protein AB7S78_01075 [Candidatus Omnitrophota bacterium]